MNFDTKSKDSHVFTYSETGLCEIVFIAPVDGVYTYDNGEVKLKAGETFRFTTKFKKNEKISAPIIQRVK